MNCKLPFHGRRLRAQERGVVNIPQGSRSVALAPGFKRESSSRQASYLHHHRHSHRLTEKIGPPHIILVSEQQVDHGADWFAVQFFLDFAAATIG